MNEIAAAFKKICYYLEDMSGRKWMVDKIHVDTYPQSFIYATFKKTHTVLVCHRQAFVFALVDDHLNKPPELYKTEYGVNNKSTSLAGYYDQGFVDDAEVRAIVEGWVKYHGLPCNFLRADFLLSSFHGRRDFEYKLLMLGIEEKNISMALNLLKLPLFNYRLFHRENVGYNLFNFLDD